MPIEPGTKLGSYEVQEFIGQGAMGRVYRAYHSQLERHGAVKVLQGMATGPDAAARFRREAQAIAQMRHPNIVNVYDFGEFEGTPYMIVEYVPGGSLAGRMQQAPLDQATALNYLRGIAAALDYAHSLGIVHRDVKPGNVLLEKDGMPVLADFGLVKLLQESSVLSMTGVTTGTPAYMAPEQVTGHEVGPAADLYSLATMAYEMLAGVIPFDGEGVLELLYAHVHREPPAPSTHNSALNPSVDAVIARGLAKSPEARWETAIAFVDALAAALAGRSLPAEPTSGPAPAANRDSAATVVSITAGRASRPAAAPIAAKSRRRLHGMIASAVILLLLLLIGGICASAEQKPTMALDRAIAVPGDTVTVTAAHIPANQVGQIQLNSSEMYSFAFQADSRGDVRQPIVIPAAITTGTHRVGLCWSGSCPLERALRIVAPGTLLGPTPSASPSPSRTATPIPKRSPGLLASPSPNPTSNPCPTPTSSATLSGPAVVKSQSTVTVTGANFPPGKPVLLSYYDPSGTDTLKKQWAATVACNGSFSTSFTADLIVVGTRADRVTACDWATPRRCATYFFTLKGVV